MPSTFTVTMLIFAAILSLSSAPLLAVYIVGGLGAIWQLLVALSQGADQPQPFLEPDDAARDA